MCWYVNRGGDNVFDGHGATFENPQCTICNGNVVHPPPMPEWVGEMQSHGRINDPDAYIGRV